MMLDVITAIEGIRVGHWTHEEAATAPPSHRSTVQPVEQVHAVLLTGGSAFGLDAATGVMRYLAERGVGFFTSGGPVPLVVGAVLYDLVISGRVWPDGAAGYAACQAAKAGPIEEGRVG